MIQNIIVLFIVFGALAYVLFTIFRKTDKKGACNCGGCSGCSLKPTPVEGKRKLL
ncbi:FeoB-associated Cys-rich membrane protein [uncultured Bacteroides sp.]|uniref:FeoB-associated Cys-rich membrane protein n=1 Tax=uncultured Bacteroides sp. TaxID=162156 RepID=UPI002AAAF96A|nr:FeoB-associated Cys-rich membrane protein [uncultured Bacteroides sp.]